MRRTVTVRIMNAKYIHSRQTIHVSFRCFLYRVKVELFSFVYLFSCAIAIAKSQFRPTLGPKVALSRPKSH